MLARELEDRGTSESLPVIIGRVSRYVSLEGRSLRRRRPVSEVAERDINLSGLTVGVRGMSVINRDRSGAGT